ncbi:MAG: hypothetical protein AAGA81_17105 [Acidobacteriota bacterium]
MNGFAPRPASRLRWRWLLAVVAVVGASVMAQAADLWWSDGGFAEVEGEGRRSQAYLLDDGALRFEIPTRAQEIRLLTTALVDRSRLGSTPEWRYGVDLDFPGRQRQQFFRSRATLFERSGVRSYALSLLGTAANSGWAPLDSRTARFKLPPADEPFTLTIRTAPSPAPTAGSTPTADAGPAPELLALRVYFKERLPEHRRSTVWPRLSERERRQRAVGNVYPPELLTEEERTELMSHRWSALAPVGVQGDDYERLVLFQHADPGQPIAESGTLQTSGLRLPAGLSYRLPAFRGRVVARSLNGGTSTGPLLVASDLQLEESVGGRETYRLASETSAQLRPKVDVALTAQPEDGEVDLRSEALRLYGCTEALEYRLTHGRAPTPLRLDVRTIAAAAASVSVELVDASGASLTKHQLDVPAVLSDWDWLDDADGPRRVSEPVRRYLTTSSGSARLRLSRCSEDVRIAVYNRPGDRPAQRSAPATEDPVRDWWVLLPLDRGAASSSLLRLQPRDDEAPPDRTSGRSLRDLRPEVWDGRYALLPLDQSEAPGYVRLGAGSQQIELAGAVGRQSVQPRLLYRRTQSTPFRLTLEVDGSVVLDEELAGRQGELVLPSLSTGLRRVALRTAPETDVFLGNVAPSATGPRFARRLLFRAPADFSVEWRHDGSRTALSGRLFAEGGVGDCRLGARVEGSRRRVGHPSLTYTFPRRRWSFGASETVAALGSDTLALQRSAPFFFLLGDDLEAGDLSVRYEVSCPSEAYLTLAVLEEAPEEDVRVWRESAP